jgi:predicted RNase H-like HicB family nuclease
MRAAKKKKLPDYCAYSAVFTEDSDGFWLAEFPDLEGCATNAQTLEEAILQAHNVLGDYMAIIEREGGNIPAPTAFDDIPAPACGIKQRIVVPMKGARKRWEDRSVNRMVTLPAWLDELGHEADLNFSQLLQSAVSKELNL